MSRGNGAPDPSPEQIVDAIAQGIEAAERRSVTMIDTQIAIASTGRPVLMSTPVDLSDVEIIELASFVLLYLRPDIVRRLGLAPGRIIVP